MATEMDTDFATQKLEYEQFFYNLNTDNNGYLSWQEFFKGMEAGGKKEPVLRKLYDYMDVDRDNKVTLEEFMGSVHNNNIIHRYRLVFNDLDRDNTGFLETHEFLRFLSTKGFEKEALEAAQRFIKSNDKNVDGKVSFEEFQAYLNDAI